jgi:hypothetical protein
MLMFALRLNFLDGFAFIQKFIAIEIILIFFLNDGIDIQGLIHIDDGFILILAVLVTLRIQLALDIRVKLHLVGVPERALPRLDIGGGIFNQIINLIHFAKTHLEEIRFLLKTAALLT